MLSSVESDLVEGVLKNISLKAIFTHKFLHASLADSLGVKNLEEFLEFIFLIVLPVDVKDNLLSAGFLSEVDKVEECGLSEAV